jgi:Tol biopolymer transport system component
VTAPAWSRDGRLAWLAAPEAGGPPWIIVRSGSTTRRVNLPFAAARDLAWSPDGTRFAIVAEAKGAATFDVYTLTTEGKDIRRITRNVDAFDVAWGS